jgi:hypothetical protein
MKTEKEILAIAETCAGGPAFPSTMTDDTLHVPGMTLRDYFAVHSTQPGVSEICSAAGVACDGQCVEVDGQHLRFDKWWQSLSNTRRFDLCAKVRYAQADAMLAAAKEKQS